MTTPLRVAFIADIHHGADHMTKRSSLALELLSKFRDFVEETKPDLIIDLGDRISDIDHETDLRLEREVAEALKPIRQPIHHICGNHDREFLSVAENEEILGQRLVNETLDVGGWRIVLWRADSKIRRPGGFLLTEADMLWLSGVVRNADRPLLIVSHVPVSGHSQVGHYYFEQNPESSTYYGAERIRSELSHAKVPVVWVSGHVHWNTYTPVNGVAHFTIQSLTESFTTFPDVAASWGMMELGEDFSLKVHGNDPFEMKVSRKMLMQRWVTRMQTFSEHPEQRIANKQL